MEGRTISRLIKRKIMKRMLGPTSAIIVILLVLIAIPILVGIHNRNQQEIDRKQIAAEHNLTGQEVDALLAKQLAKTEPAQQDRNDAATNSTRHDIENRANDLLLQFPKSKQTTALAAAVADGCIGTRAFYMGISPTDRVAYWSVA